ncbi:MAG TPA: serine/threonine-protein kinase, partial [Gemmatimonadaceae bacterium]|nr:serine/threonine-protein kinase [Gemmatimonadaceae bacterium]
MTQVVYLRRWSDVQAAFDALVDLDDPERRDRLAALGDTDPELRGAVESLLAADSEADTRLARLEDALLPQETHALDPLGLAGRTISHFRLFEPIGVGGMGVVYRAEDVRLGRPVALKFLLPAAALDPLAVARFRREALSAAALDHPNLCTILEVGASDDGRLFLAMPLYAGETLKARLANDRAIPVDEVLTIARQVAAGLESAHAAGIVHRDLKPANIMLLPDGTARILDFGLAKARDQSLSASRERFGTVWYMAPEQICGDTVDGRADLWALGVVLFEMLTGRKPFDGDEAIAVARAALHDEPAPLSIHRRDVPAALEEIVLTLLRKDRGQRHATAGALLVDLARVGTSGDGLVVSLRRRWHRTRRRLPAQWRRVVTSGAVLIAFGAFAVGAIAARRTAQPAAGARTAIAVLPFRNLSADGEHAYLAGGLHE